MKHPGAAFFDFDGTITEGDSFLRFLVYATPRPRFFLGLFLLLPVVLLYGLRLISAHVAKAAALYWCFRGEDYLEFRNMAEEFSKAVIPGLVRPEALKRIQWHQSQGHRIFLVSASVEEWVSGFAREHGMEVIATQMEVVDGKLSGRLKTPNNFGPEKVRRIHERVNLRDFEHTWAYGDTRGDKEMLAMVDVGVFKPFH